MPPAVGVRQQDCMKSGGRHHYQAKINYHGNTWHHKVRDDLRKEVFNQPLNTSVWLQE